MSTDPIDQQLRKELAAIEHERWSSWQKWVFEGCGDWNADGSFTINAEKAAKMKRQIATDYKDLTIPEQDADLREVDRYWSLIDTYAARRAGLGDSDSHSETAQALGNQVATLSAEMQPATYLEAWDDVNGMGMTYRMHIGKVDYQMAHFSEFDYALLHPIDHGKKSSTPMADQLLGLEMIVRRIEEAKAKKGVST